MQLKIAVISDFHCHNKAENGKLKESYILTDEDVPLFQDPFKSVEFLIDDQKLTADLLIMPGDFTNKANLKGLIKGWEITKEIGRMLKVTNVIPNVGNHDVDSRQSNSPDAFEYIKSFAYDFPFPKAEDNKFFWEKGYIIIDEPQYRILVINTVHSHKDEIEATHGLISQDAINQIETKLASIADTKINIAVCHHNPIEHSHYNTGSKDFMYNGDELISILDKYNFDIIIHGHKHDPRIRYAQGGSNPPVIFSAGSFCAFSNLLLQGAHNTFHIISMEIQEGQIGRGIIDTWFFVPTKGWKQEIKNTYFESRIGFGAMLDLKQEALSILSWFEKQEEKIIEWEAFIMHFPGLQYIIPSDFEKLRGHLKGKNVYISPNIPNEPIYVLHKPTKQK